MVTCFEKKVRKDMLTAMTRSKDDKRDNSVRTSEWHESKSATGKGERKTKHDDDALETDNIGAANVPRPTTRSTKDDDDESKRRAPCSTEEEQNRWTPGDCTWPVSHERLDKLATVVASIHHPSRNATGKGQTDEKLIVRRAGSGECSTIEQRDEHFNDQHDRSKDHAVQHPSASSDMPSGNGSRETYGQDESGEEEGVGKTLKRKRCSTEHDDERMRDHGEHVDSDDEHHSKVSYRRHNYSSQVKHARSSPHNERSPSAQSSSSSTSLSSFSTSSPTFACSPSDVDGRLTDKRRDEEDSTVTGMGSATSIEDHVASPLSKGARDRFCLSAKEAFDVDEGQAAYEECNEEPHLIGPANTLRQPLSAATMHRSFVSSKEQSGKHAAFDGRSADVATETTARYSATMLSGGAPQRKSCDRCFRMKTKCSRAAPGASIEGPCEGCVRRGFGHDCVTSRPDFPHPRITLAKRPRHDFAATGSDQRARTTPCSIGVHSSPSSRVRAVQWSRQHAALTSARMDGLYTSSHAEAKGGRSLYTQSPKTADYQADREKHVAMHRVASEQDCARISSQRPAAMPVHPDSLSQTEAEHMTAVSTRSLTSGTPSSYAQQASYPSRYPATKRELTACTPLAVTDRAYSDRERLLQSIDDAHRTLRQSRHHQYDASATTSVVRKFRSMHTDDLRDVLIFASQELACRVTTTTAPQYLSSTSASGRLSTQGQR